MVFSKLMKENFSLRMPRSRAKSTKTQQTDIEQLQMALVCKGYSSNFVFVSVL